MTSLSSWNRDLWRNRGEAAGIAIYGPIGGRSGWNRDLWRNRGDRGSWNRDLWRNRGEAAGIAIYSAIRAARIEIYGVIGVKR
ncbi:hypothetical protein AMTR_s00005p00262390 [Amborella trichopoda]|uniref:Uncharacterized protein n=1 Tax=Amborella trichopoda TaxID=13333 RepID=W1PG45_AMBTC|nr:hypothetical protein AMTR_s00005p00262390 [Amborella trichopoda]